MIHRKPLYALSGLASLALAAQLVPSAPLADSPALAVDSPVPVVAAAHMTKPGTATASLAERLQRDPMALADMGLERYTREVKDYSCVFHKQERIDGKLGAEQQIKVLYREAPHSVFMTWLKNEDQCRRALYVRDRHVNSKGEQEAMVEPAGALVRLIVSETLVPIHGARSRKASRRTIDEFGFKSTLDLLMRYNNLAKGRGVLEISYVGEGKVDERPTFVLVRNLPYTGPDCEFPDARMIIHFDQEWLLPVAVYSYADKQEKVLLGSYIMTEVKLNQGLGDAAFKF